MPFTPERDSAVNESARRQPASSESPVRKHPSRPKKPPPITPRRFHKFFTPRPFHGHRAVRTSRTALQHISGPVLNQRANNKRYKGAENDKDAIFIPSNSRGRKRKLSFASASTTPQRPTTFFLPSSQEIPDGHAANHASLHRSPSKQVDIYKDDDLCGEEASESDGDEDEATWTRPARPAVRQYRGISTSTSLLSARLSGRRTRTEPGSSNLWQDEASAFYSGPSDVYSCTGLYGPVMTLPFCTASCNTNSLTAVGDEQGGIRLLDSARGNRDGFTKHYLALHTIHDNAVMDMTFSDDDALLATASGDQESHVVDMWTQQIAYRLCGHTASVKRVQFQPGSSNNVLATCSRDGNINIWDLRSRPDRPSLHLRSSPSAQADCNLPPHPPVNHIRAAHTALYAKYRNADEATIECARGKGRYNESSVTSLAFLPDPGRSHLLVSGSEAHSTVKLWDMRTLYNARRPRPHPVSTTEEPPNHRLHRRYGLTSLAFSGDGARLYSLCRDHTVYAYSTSHLILGDAPELSMTVSRPRRPGGSERAGLGPLYAFRHPQFSVSTFYLKLAVRKATVDKPELLAIGSSNNCAIIFPTAERYLNPSTQRTTPAGSSFSSESTMCEPQGRPHGEGNRKASEFNTFSQQQQQQQQQHQHNMPVYHQHGTALIRGHEKEVTAVTWNYDGSLTTVSDDFTVRCWREDGPVARRLRQGGEAGGQRWMAGWADVSDKAYDDDE